MKLTKSQLKQIIKEELALVLELGFGQGKPASDKWSKKQEIVLEEEDEEEKNNPWAICTAQVGRKDKEKYERCVKSVKKKLNEQRSKFADDPPKRLARIDTRKAKSTTPAKKILQKAKKDFIKINVEGKFKQIATLLMKKKKFTKHDVVAAYGEVIGHIKKVRLDFVCTGDSCREGQIAYKSCPYDPDNFTKQLGVPNMFYSEEQNAIALCNWETQWSKVPPKKLYLAYMHELGHAKSYVLGSLAVAAGGKKEKYMSQQKTGGEGEVKPSYGASLYHKLKPYFNVSNKPDAPHGQQPEEVNAMRQQALQFLGRANLIPEDFQMICQRTSKRQKLSWKNKTPTAKSLSWEEFGTFYGKFSGLELWTKLKRRACRNMGGFRRTMNTLARAGQPKGPPRRMTA